MAAHWSDLGFQVETDDQLSKLARAASHAGSAVPAADGACYCWAPGEGVEVWAHVSPEGELRDCYPHFAGNSEVRARIVDLHGDGRESPRGRVQAWSGTRLAGPPLILELPDLELVREQLACPITVSLQVAAFAHAAECFPDETSFALWQEGRPTPMAPDCFIPSGAFAQPPRPEAAFAGRIEQAHLKINPATGLPFHHLRVRTGIGTIDVVADPDGLDGIPVPGGLLQGYFSLTGRVLAVG